MDLSASGNIGLKIIFDVIKEGAVKLQNTSIFMVLILLTLIFSYACREQKSEWGGTVKEIDGVTVVKNPKEPLYPESSIKFEEDLSIGVDEGEEDYMFSYPVEIDSDSEGNIYILDYRELRIKKYDANGIFKQNIGRKGEGPGEFQYPYGLCISSSDILYVGDGLTRKIEILDCEGKPQNTLVTDFSCSDISICPDGKLVIYYNRYKQRDEERRRISKIGIYDYQQDKMTDFFETERPLFDSLQSKEYRIDLPSERFDMDSKGNLLIGTNNKYEIHVFAPTEEKSLIFSKPYEPIPLDREIRAKAMKQLSKSSFPKVLSEYEKFIENHPIFDSLSIDEKDRIWIRLFQPLGVGEICKSAIYDVFSAEGKYLFSTQINKGIIRQIIFKNGYAYTLSKNELGYSRALRFKTSEN